MVAVIGSEAIVATLLHKILAAIAEHVIQPDWSRSGTKVGSRVGGLGFRIAQGPAGHTGLYKGPVVITYGAPGTTVVQLQPAIPWGGGGLSGAVGQAQRVGVNWNIWSEREDAIEQW